MITWPLFGHLMTPEQHQTTANSSVHDHKTRGHHIHQQPTEPSATNRNGSPRISGFGVGVPGASIGRWSVGVGRAPREKARPGVVAISKSLWVLDVIRAGAVTTCDLRHLAGKIDPAESQRHLPWRQFTRSGSSTTYLPGVARPLSAGCWLWAGAEKGMSR